ncbi:MAG: hypothetical protein ACI9DC_000509 [Gammaproteobacteria bacterium]|jgi:hypothetical protein
MVAASIRGTEERLGRLGVPQNNQSKSEVIAACGQQGCEKGLTLQDEHEVFVREGRCLAVSKT